MVRINLNELRQLAMDRPGMFADLLQSGKICGIELEIEQSEIDRIQAQYFPGIKLGTIIHKVLKPLVKAADNVLGTSYSSCGGCAQRRMKLDNKTANKETLTQ